MRSHTVNGTSDRLSCSEDLFDDSRQFLGHGPGPHDAGSIQDVIHGDVTVVFDVFDLLTITWGLFQGLDDQGCGRGNDIDSGLTILDGQPDCDLETFPVLGGLGNIVTNLLG